MRISILRPSALFLAAIPVLALAAPQRWTESGEAFRKGTLGDSGHNIHVNRHGELEVIRHYDLDQNGHLDLLFNSTHDTDNALPATLLRFGTGRAPQISELAIDGSADAVPVDLNRDGFTDLAFLPNRPNLQHSRNSLFIAWGSAEGWSTQRVSRQLPVNGATRIAVGDLNGDGWPDLISLNTAGWLHGQPKGNIIRVYWGAEKGFVLLRHHDLGVADAIDIATGDFGLNGAGKLAVLTSKGRVEIYRADDSQLVAHGSVSLPVTNGDKKETPTRMLSGRGAGLSAALLVATNTSSLYAIDGRATVHRIEAAPATHIAAGKLDGDDQPDIVLTNRELRYPLGKPTSTTPSVTILWGSQGTTSEKATRDIPNASAATIADVDGDGRSDLLVAVFQGKETQKTSSLVFLGDGSRRLAEKAIEVPTEGAESVVVARLRENAPPTAIFANSQHRTVDDHVPLPLYWGSAKGFSRESSFRIPNLSGNNSGGADLNGDGFLDLYTVNGSDISSDAAARAPHSGVIIYWGGKEGNMAGPGPNRFDLGRRQVLTEFHIGVVNAADVNRDGFLDLVLGAYESSDPKTEMIVYYGSADGYSRERRKTVPLPGRSVTELVADINRDGWLDVVITSYNTNEILTFWGGEQGFTPENRDVLPYPAPIDSEAADLNGDGWLDLLIASYEDPVSQSNDMGVTVFWGSEKGIRHDASFWLPGTTPLGLAVADVDGDNFLDIVVPCYHSELTREHIPQYIFWGDKDGFAPLRRTVLIVNSASDVMVADFNGDGRKDLAFSAHSFDRGHHVESPIFFNDGRRFAKPEVQYLPAIGPHFMWIRDVGNISNRRYEETFTSQPIALQSAAKRGRVSADATRTTGGEVRIQIRSAVDEKGLEKAQWRDAKGGSFQLNDSGRALQYRLVLTSSNGDAYPKVKGVKVELE